MKHLIISLSQILFFILLFVVSHIIEADKNILWITKITLLAIISIIQVKLFAREPGRNLILYSIVSLTIIFELYKFIEFYFGFLSKYGEVPLILSILLSLFVFSLYITVLRFAQKLFFKLKDYLSQ